MKEFILYDEDNKSFNLPYDFSEVTQRAIARVFGDMGSIKRCGNTKEFGLYRHKLVKSYEIEIAKLNKKIKQLEELNQKLRKR